MVFKGHYLGYYGLGLGFKMRALLVGVGFVGAAKTLIPSDDSVECHSDQNGT